MALARTYLSIDGVIQSEHRAGEAHSRDYMLDPSGNVVGVYITDYMQANASCSPFSSVLDSWNMGSYKFQFGGGRGYRQTETMFVSAYVRARHYSNLDGGWTTRDPLWPSETEMPYGYVEGRVPGGADPSGMELPVWIDPFTGGFPIIDPKPGGSIGFPKFNLPPFLRFRNKKKKPRPPKPQEPKPTQSPYDPEGRPGLPPGGDYVNNCCEARKHRGDVMWFYNNVRLGSRFDYKQRGGMYEDAGNYHYGFLAACLGLPLGAALRAAGLAQVVSGNYEPGSGIPVWVPPFGDDKVDQYFISKGYENSAKNLSSNLRKCSPPMGKCFENYKTWRDRSMEMEMEQGAELPGNTQWWKNQ